MEAKVAVAFSDNASNHEAWSLAMGNVLAFREMVNVSQFLAWNYGTTEPPTGFPKLTESEADFLNSPESGGVLIKVLTADGQKCERCWHSETDIGVNPEHPTLCGRCVEAVK